MLMSCWLNALVAKREFAPWSHDRQPQNERWRRFHDRSASRWSRGNGVFSQHDQRTGTIRGRRSSRRNLTWNPRQRLG